MITENLKKKEQYLKTDIVPTDSNLVTPPDTYLIINLSVKRDLAERNSMR